MRKFLLWLLLLALIPTAIFAARRLDAMRASGSFLRDARWSGVLRVRDHSSLPVSAWLERRAAAFARRRRGVRVQIIDATGEALSWSADDPLAPDAVVWTPGMLLDADGLRPLPENADLLPGLAEAGRQNGATYAAPVAMGAYFWIADADRCPLVPGDPSLDGEPLLACPADDATRSWSAALLAMFSGTARQRGAAIPLAGVDLGLADEAPEPEATAVPYALPRALPEDFRTQAAVPELLRAGRADAILATQAELRRLTLLAESGRAPEPVVYPGGAAFTDQVALVSIPLSDREDAEARAAIAEEFIAFLQAEDSQAVLADVWAFRVTAGPALYRADRAGMAAVEAAYSRGVIAPGAFGDGWRALASFAWERLLREGGDPAAVLAEALR